MDFQGRLLPRVRSMLSGPDQTDGLADPLKGHAGPRHIGGRVRTRQRKSQHVHAALHNARGQVRIHA